MAGEPDSPGHPQGGSSGSKVVCSAKVSALAGGVAHLHYIRFTSSYGISFQKGMGSGVQLELHLSADYERKAVDRRSMSGGVVMCAGACVSFFSRAQKRAKLSCTEAAYVALATGSRETIVMRYV